jgi:hypothetical protein
MTPIDDLAFRIVAKFPHMLFEEARAQATEMWATPAVRICNVWLTSERHPQAQTNPFAAEFFAQAILRRLGIRTADARICSAQEARELPGDFVVKFAKEQPAQVLHWNPDAVPIGWCLASRLVPGAASLGYLARKIVNSHGGKSDRSDKFFGEFRPTATEIEKIKSAITPDGVQYLAICAARAFFGTGCTPHFGNVLVTRDGQLVSIDHCEMNFGAFEDLRALFRYIERGDVEHFTKVAALTEDEVRAAVAEIPKHPACGSVDGLAEYFTRRLELWKSLYSCRQDIV